MKTERLALGLALVAAGVLGSPSPQHLSGRSGPAAFRSVGSVGAGSSAFSAGSEASAGQDGFEIQNACTDGAYNLNGHRWSTTLSWRFQVGSRPKGFSATGTAAALRRAASNIAAGRNNCDLPDAISATHSYRGTTSRAPNIGSSGGCRGRDGVNVVGFGTLPSGYLGMTCWWTFNGRVVEADIKLNKAYYHWYINRPSGCSYKWSIEGAATHEFGHAFGLSHVSEANHGSLTMSPVIRACQDAERTLGLGDILGLRALY